MPDREKVIKGLECCAHPYGNCTKCPYDDGTFYCTTCTSELCCDALDLLKEQKDLGEELTNAVELIHKKNERIEKLLKEQEPIEPKMIIDGFGERYRCKCGTYLFKCGNYRWDYCPYCGTKVKWE